MNHATTTRGRLIAALSGLGLILAGCHPHDKPGNGLDGLDNRLVDGGVVADNAATRALGREIRVDPQAKPVAASAAAAARGEPGRCLDGLVYARAWATRLPDDLPMHPRATLQEAAGHDGACQARVVSFTVPGDRGSVIAWYAAQARAAGYSVGRDDKDGDWNLAGGKGDAVYYIMAGPTRGGATPVDYVWSSGG